MLSQQGNLPVFDVSGGLAFVQVGQGGAGGTTGTATASADGKTTSTDSVTGLPTDIGGRDPYGFMRVFVVGGGVNLPAANQAEPGNSSAGTPSAPESQEQRRNRPQ